MPARSTALTGLSVATGIAQDATDGIPIVKQVLSGAARLLTLAQQVDKNREDLRALADRAKKMAETTAGIVSGRDPDVRIVGLLEELNGIIAAIDKLFSAHVKRGRVRKIFSYIFTVRRDIDHLTGEFDNCLSLLQTAVSVHVALSVGENSNFVGNVHKIRDCEIDSLHSIKITRGPGDRVEMSDCKRGRIEEKPVVVRRIKESFQSDYGRRGIEEHIKVLDRMSLIENRHRNIARLYGRDSDPLHNRFIVLAAGDVRTLGDVLFSGQAEVSILGIIVAHVTDALCHIIQHGAWWDVPWFGNEIFGLCLDHNLEPKLGIRDDLSTIPETPEIQASLIPGMFTKLLCSSRSSPRFQQKKRHRAFRRSTMWKTQLFGELLDAGFSTQTRASVVRRAEIESFIPLGAASGKYLREIKESSLCSPPNWGDILLCLATGKKRREGSILHAKYRSSQFEEHDYIDVFCVEDEVDAVYHTWTEIEISWSAVDDVRHRLGITMGDGEEEGEDDDDDDDEDGRDLEFHLHCFAGDGPTSLERSRWTRHMPVWTED